MRRLLLVLGVVFSLSVRSVIIGQEAQPAEKVTFRALDVWIEAGEKKLAAYQVEVRYPAGRVKIVGIEGGAVGPFNAAPYYDRAGQTGGRIVLAAFIVEDKIAPTGRFRVGRLHLQIEGDGKPELTIQLVTAAKPGGERIAPTLTLADPNGRNEK